MMTLSTRERDAFHRRMAEEAAAPEHVRRLRQQVRRIECERELDVRRQLAEMEANRLRRRIRDMGEKPCA